MNRSTPAVVPVMVLVLALAPLPAAGQVVISEIMSNPVGSEFTDEFVELRNMGEGAVDLAGWRLGDGAVAELLRAAIGDAGSVLGPGAFALVLDPDYRPEDGAYGAFPAGLLLLTVSGHTLGESGFANDRPERVVLVNADGDTVDIVTYDPSVKEGFSWEREDATPTRPVGFAASRWSGGTPGRVNSRNPKRRDLAVAFAAPPPAVVPAGQDARVALRVTNAGREPVPAPAELLVVGEGGKPVQRIRFAPPTPGTWVGVDLDLPGAPGTRSDFEIRVLASGDADTTNNAVGLRVRFGVLPGSVVISEIDYLATGGREWVEVANVGSDPVDLAGWGLRDAAGTRGQIASGDRPFLSEHVGADEARLVPPGGRAVLVATHDAVETASHEGLLTFEVEPWPTLNNGGDALTLMDPAETVIDRVVYVGDRAAPGQSLERVRLDGPSDRAENWLGSTDPTGATPGRENSVAFRAYADLALAVTPNPFPEEARITVQTPSEVARLSLTVYDDVGRRVRGLLLGASSGSQRTVVWDGRGEGGGLVRPGSYILLLEATLPAGKTLRTTSVLAFVGGMASRPAGKYLYSEGSSFPILD